MGDVRQRWIDSFKGLAIILVVIGHLKIDSNLFRVIYSFHLYCFYFVSGFTFRYNRLSLCKVLKKGIMRLYIPYLFFELLWDITFQVETLYFTGNIGITISEIPKHIIAIMLCMNVDGVNVSFGPCWFLISLFTVRIVYYLLSRITNNIGWGFWGKFVIVLLLFGLGFVLVDTIELPFRIIQSLTAFIFVLMGEYCSLLGVPNYVKRLPNIIIFIVSAISIILVVILSLLMSDDLLLVANSLPDNPLLVFLCGLFGVVFLMMISVLFETKRIHLFEKIGMNSMIIMGTSSEIAVLLRLVLEKIGMNPYYTPP